MSQTEAFLAAYRAPRTPEDRMRVNGEVPRIVGDIWWRAFDKYRTGAVEEALRLLRDSLVALTVERPFDDGSHPDHDRR